MKTTDSKERSSKSKKNQKLKTAFGFLINKLPIKTNKSILNLLWSLVFLYFTALNCAVPSREKKFQNTL